MFTTEWLHGFCSSPDNPFDRDVREIWIDPKLRGQERMESLIHEGTHAELPTLTEEQVTALGRNIKDLLWRDGYRRPGEKKRGRSK